MSAPQLNWLPAKPAEVQDSQRLEYYPAPEPEELKKARDEEVMVLPRAKRWVKDDTRLWDGKFLGCQICNAEFDFFNRRHHCRVCGSLVCHNCSKTLLLVEGYNAPQRVCTLCHGRHTFANPHAGLGAKAIARAEAKNRPKVEKSKEGEEEGEGEGERGGETEDAEASTDDSTCDKNVT